ncbi:5-hydroxytryptamine receptor 1E [Drosophila montana]|uniref:5-hydroxytryptamine receptor 1E n=1 Tax=Drosophila montana TaxID=40370 RepID=UPI00313B1636
MALVTVLFLCTFLGNVSALYVNTRRKLRPFFRACLISLACSDLIYCVNFTTSNIAMINAEYLEYWILGPFMCNTVPFVNTTTVLCSSFMLVAIALDRYMAIRRAAIGIWNPGLVFCAVCIAGIWLASMAAAVPLFFIYTPIQVYIQSTDELLISELDQVTMCVGRRTQIGIYNSVSLSLVFVPCIVAFVFLNATIARQLWQRRHQQRNLQQQQKEQQREQEQQQEQPRFVHLLSKPETTYAMMTAFSVAASFDMSTAQLAGLTPPPPTTPLPEKVSPAAAARVARHRRMVRVVLLMMGAFICLRLPAWTFLLMRVYGSFSSPVSWMFYFSFGLLNLTSCALNPLFYTFLPQTMRVLSKLKRALSRLFCCRRASKLESDATMPQETAERGRRCLCCGLQVTWRCHLKSPPAAAGSVATQTVAVIEAPSAASSLPPVGDCKDDWKDLAIYNENSLQTTASMKSSR